MLCFFAVSRLARNPNLNFEIGSSKYKTDICFAITTVHIGLSYEDAQTETIGRLMAKQSSVLVPRLSTEMILKGDTETAKKMRALVSNEAAEPNTLRGKRIAIITTDGVEEVEATIPLNFFRARGAMTDIVAAKKPVYSEGAPVQVPDVRETYILTVRYMENSGWLEIERFLDEEPPIMTL